MSELFLGGKIELRPGDCRDIIKAMPDNSIDSVVTDPPYALVSIVKRFGGANAAPAKGNDAYMRQSAGFMGQKWDTGETAFAAEFWAEVLRVLKPGGHVVAFGGTRTFHRLVVAIEDSGFEIRDQLSWIFGSGFQKSHNAGNGLGTALKPAHEPICLARKPLVGTVAANVLEWGTGAINIDATRIGTEGGGTQCNNRDEDGKCRGHKNAGQSTSGETFHGPDTQGGRWPANIVHDGSDEVLAGFPHTKSGLLQTHHKMAESENGSMSGKNYARSPNQDSSAARFFYTAKADKLDRMGSKHPTVKPVDLMQWLVRLVTPKGGLVLDPFAGSGSTGEAVFYEGMRCILCEREPEYQDSIRKRLSMVIASTDDRKAASVKPKPRSDGPDLFS